MILNPVLSPYYSLLQFMLTLQGYKVKNITTAHVRLLYDYTLSL